MKTARKTKQLSSRFLWRKQFFNVELSAHRDACAPPVYSIKGEPWHLCTANARIYTFRVPVKMYRTPWTRRSTSTCTSSCICSTVYSRSVVIMWCGNSLRSTGNIFHKILHLSEGKGCSRNLFQEPATPASASGSLTLRPGYIPFHPECAGWGSRSGFCAGQRGFSTPHPERKALSLQTLLCTWTACHFKTGKGLPHSTKAYYCPNQCFSTPGGPWFCNRKRKWKDAFHDIYCFIQMWPRPLST